MTGGTLSYLDRQGRQRHDSLGMVTGGIMLGTDAARNRRRRPAARVGKGTPPGIIAARRSLRLRPDQLCAATLPDAARARLRNGLQQCTRIGMRAPVEEILRPPLLDDAAEIHHGDFVAE